MFSVFTTRASGYARWICSPRLSVLQTVSVSRPVSKVSGLATSISTLPARFSAPAAASASSDTAPPVQFITVWPNSAASANVPCDAFGPASCAHAAAASLSGVRDPNRTS